MFQRKIFRSLRDFIFSHCRKIFFFKKIILSLPENFFAHNDAFRSAVNRTKCLQRICVSFDNIFCGIYLSVHHYQYAPAFCVFIRGSPHGLPEIHGAVRADGRSRTHGAGQHCRLLCMHCQLQEVRRLFQGVCAVGDDDAVHVAADRDLICVSGQLQPDAFLHVLAVNVAQLFPGQIGQPFQSRHGGDQLPYGQLPRFIPNCGRSGSRLSGNGSSRGDNIHMRFLFHYLSSPLLPYTSFKISSGASMMTEA